LDLPSELTLSVGEEVTLPLAGAGAAGYQWTSEVEGDSGDIVVSIATIPPASGHVTGGDPPAAGSHPVRLSIRAVRTGRAIVHLRLARSFAPDQVARTETIHVAVS
jgi:hypothetical protein